MDSQEFQTRLRALRDDYLTHLPERLFQIRAAWAEAQQDGATPEQLQALRRLVHNLSGSGATFGFQDIGQAAQRLESLLKIILEHDSPITDTQRGQVGAYIDALDLALQRVVNGPSMHAAPVAAAKGSGVEESQPGELLFLVEDDTDFAEHFAASFEQHGYQVRVFNDCTTLNAAVAAAQPVALIMDMILPRGELAGAEAVHRLREEFNQLIPVIFLSVRDDFESRLAAVQAGATHYFTKPLSIEKLLRVFDETVHERPKEPYRVLVVDDDAYLTDMYRMYLEEAGMVVKVLSEPLAVMSALRSFGPDLVLMDIYMPACNGLELAAVMRQFEEFDQIPIVFLTAEWHTDKIMAAMNLGSDDFLTKPVMPWQLVATLKARIRRARTLRRGASEVRHALRELEQFKSALDQHAIVSVADSSGLITHANDKFCEMSGYRRNELLGNSHRIVKSGAHAPEFYEQLWATIASGKVWQGEIRNRNKSGGDYWVETTIVPIVDDFGVPQRYISIRTDITQIKQVEERLRVSQVYANIGTWDWNIQTGELYWSERIGPLFGYPEGKLETTYQNFLNAVHPDDRQRVIDAVNAAAEHDAQYDIEHRCVWPDGSVHWLLERGAAVRDAAGKPRNMLGVVQDITERKLAQLALQDSEQRLREAQRIAHIGHWSWDVTSGQLAWSDEIYRIFGRTPGEFEPTYERFLAVLHPDDVGRIKQSEQEAFAKGEKHSIDHRIVLPSGEVRWVHEEAEAVKDAAGKPLSLSGTVQDITGRKQAEAGLLQAMQEAERANRAKSAFLSSMSHELRTPLNAILGFGQLLESDAVAPLSTDQKDSVEHILKAGWHLLELINEVLDLAKIESGKVDLSIESVDPVELMAECLDLMAAMADLRSIQLSNRSTATGEYRVRADRTRLKQALLNLLSNAIKYNRNKGAVTVDINRMAAGWVSLSVTDTGPGLSKQQCEQLFQPFNRLGAEQTAVEGSGIGLVITKRVVEMMGGLISVVSKPGDGSTFCIELQEIVKPQQDLPATGGVELAGVGAEAPLRTILYVEDNPANLQLVAQILARCPNNRMLSAHTGGLGLQLARSIQPDLIILDINLPGMDGYEVLAQLRRDEETRHIPVIALSANALPRDIERGLSAGFAHYLTKPVRSDELKQAITELIGNKPGMPIQL